MRRRHLLLAVLPALAVLACWLLLGDPPAPAGDTTPGSTPVAAATADPQGGQLERPPEAERQQRVEQALPTVAARPMPLAGPPPDPRIRGHVCRGGLPVADREVYVLGDPTRSGITLLTTRTDAAGQYDVPVPGAGTYRVRVPWAGLVQVLPSSAGRGRDAEVPGFAAAQQEVEVGRHPVGCELSLSTAGLRLVARAAPDRRPLAGVEVAFTFADGTDLTGWTGADGTLLALDLPPAECRVAAALRGFRGPAPSVVDPRGPCPEDRELLFTEACILDLRVATATGARLAATAAPGIEVVHAATGAVHVPRPFRPWAGANRAPDELRFEDLEAGAYGVRIADVVGEEQGNHTVRFQPHEALAPLLVSVAPGAATTAEFRIRPRTYFEIRGRPRQRAEEPPALAVELLDPQQGLRRVLPTPRPQLSRANRPQFGGYLVDGTYWLSFRGPAGQLHRVTMQVPGQGPSTTIALPW